MKKYDIVNKLLGVFVILLVGYAIYHYIAGIISGALGVVGAILLGILIVFFLPFIIGTIIMLFNHGDM